MMPTVAIRHAITRFLARYGSPINDRALQWVLSINDIPESENVTYADLELATFNGYAARAANTPLVAPSYWSNGYSNFVPINMATGANGGTFFQFGSDGRAQFIFYKNAAGSGSENPTITLTQAEDDIGTNEKPLAIARSWVKTDADLSLVPSFSAGEPTANSLTVAASAQKQAIWVIEVHEEDLDNANGFSWFRAIVPDVGAVSQLGGMMMIMLDDSDGPEDFRWGQGIGTDDGFVTPTAAIPGLFYTVGSEANLPQTVYGISLVSVTGEILYGYHRLTHPVTLTAIGQSVQLRVPGFRLNEFMFVPGG